MMRWRERIEAAKAKGRFTKKDRDDAETGEFCLVGEAAALLGFRYEDVFDKFHVPVPGYYDYARPADELLVPVGGAFPQVVRVNDFVRAEKLVDAVEDRLLQLKREMVL